MAAPSHISREAKAIWRKLAPILSDVGLLTEADVTEFGRLCELLSEARLLRKTLHKDGWTIREEVLDSNGANAGERIKNHPAIRALRTTETAIIALADRFGLNPARRGVIKIEGGGKTNAFEDFLNRVRNAQSSPS